MGASKEPKASDEALQAYVVDHDVEMWMRRVKVGRAFDECRSRIGAVSRKRFKDSVEKYCKHYRKIS